MRFTGRSKPVVADNMSIKSTVSLFDRLPFWRSRQSFRRSSTIELRAPPVETPAPKQPKVRPTVVPITTGRGETATTGRKLSLGKPSPSTKFHPRPPTSQPTTPKRAIPRQQPPPSPSTTTEADQQSLSRSPPFYTRSPTLSSLTSASSIQSTPPPSTPTSSSSPRLSPSTSPTTSTLRQKQRPDSPSPLVLTLTSKYPTGLAAELYIPVDVSLPPGTKATVKGKMPGLKSKGGFGDLRGLGRGMGIGGSGKEKGLGLDTVPEKRMSAGTWVEGGSRRVIRAATRTEGEAVGKRKVVSAETGTGTATRVGDRTGVKIVAEAEIGTGIKPEVGKRKMSGVGMRTKSGLGVEGETRNGTGFWNGARRNSVIGTGAKTEARAGFGGAGGFTVEFMRSGGSVLKKRRQSISSQFYY